MLDEWLLKVLHKAGVKKDSPLEAMCIVCLMLSIYFLVIYSHFEMFAAY